MTVDSYVSLLSTLEVNSHAEYHLAYDCRQAYNLINKLEVTGIVPDVAFFDVNLPPYPERNINSGIDAARLLKKAFPLCKVVIISMHNEPVWVNRIFKSINPEGFVAKSEINYKIFPEAYTLIVNGGYYFSPSITESQRFFIQKNINWDEYDSQILLLISEGKKTINLPDYIALSLSTIEKRKANMKKQLVFENGSDKELIEVAKKLGLL